MKEFRYRITVEQVVKADKREDADREHYRYLDNLRSTEELQIVDRRIYKAVLADKRCINCTKKHRRSQHGSAERDGRTYERACLAPGCDCLGFYAKGDDI